MIKVENASFGYEGGQSLFSHLDFEVKKGETLAILGANGIGKTTFLRCLMGFLKLDEGKMRIAGRDIAQLPTTEFWKLVSYVPQAKNLVFGYSVLNMVVMGRSQYVPFGRVPNQKDYDQARGILEDLGLADLADRSCNKLSGGQLQMVLIARALSKNPEILIMDEPESNLDMKNQLKVLNIIDQLSHRNNLAVIINTHFPANAMRCSDKTLLLKSGGHLFGDTSDVINRENIQEYFDISAEVVNVRENGRRYQGIVPIDILPGEARPA